MAPEADARRDYRWVGLSNLMLLGLFLLAGIACRPLTGKIPEEWLFSVSEFLALAGVLISAYWCAKKTRVDVKSLFKPCEGMNALVLKGTAAVAGTAFTVSWLAAAARTLLARFGRELLSPSFVLSGNLGSDLLLLVSVALVGPLAEEVFFRGVLLRVLCRYGRRFGIAASALLFALQHRNFPQGVNAFLIGIALAGVVCVTGSLLPAVLIHMLNNAYGLLLGELFTDAPVWMMSMAILLYLMLGIGGAIYAFYTLVRNRERIPRDTPEQRRIGARLFVRSWPVRICFLAFAVFLVRSIR